MKKCPACSSYSFQRELLTLKYRCIICDHRETEKDKRTRDKEVKKEIKTGVYKLLIHE
ncbi:MAG: hypothetical protein HQM08_30190 [Candidatus Riflebacteria bacterium]|nr:hypothetical protein [Candidatus Riflebacteria bacterium]